MHSENLLFLFCFFPTGVYNYQVEEDISKLKLCVISLLQEYGLNVNIKDDYIHELCVLLAAFSAFFLFCFCKVDRKSF